jgi:hypothetical protein
MMVGAVQGLKTAGNVWRLLEASGCGDPNDVDDNIEYDSAMVKEILKVSNLDVIGLDLCTHSLPVVGNAEDPGNLWTPLATDLMRLYRDIPAEILPNELLERGRLERGGYVVCSGATDGKTHTAMWLMKKLKSLPDETRPQGFMVTGNGRKEDEDYASFVARSLRVDRKIDPARLVNLIVAVLSFGNTSAKRPPIMILDNFDRVQPEDKTFVRLLAHSFANMGFTFVALCQHEEAAEALVKINGWQRIKGFPGLCTESPPVVNGKAELRGWSPTWRDSSWSHRLLTKLIQNRFPEYDWDIDMTTKNLQFLLDDPPDGLRWGPSSAVDHARLVVSKSPRRHPAV